MENISDDTRVRELHDLIQKEQDPRKLAELAEELTRVLEEKIHHSQDGKVRS